MNRNRWAHWTRIFGDVAGSQDPAIRCLRWAILLTAVCALPLLLIGAGVNLSSAWTVPEDGVLTSHFGEAANRALAGSFTHTLLEWTAVCAAAFVCMLCLVQYRLTSEPSLPVIGIALACAGAMDAFHTLAADRLISAVADNRQLIPFTWTVCRLFNAGILLLGVGLFALWRPRRLSARRSLGLVTAISLFFVVLAYAIVYACAASESLPQTMFANSLIKRPYDIYPIFLYAICALVVFPRFIARHPSPFSCALWLSLIPQIAAQLYMAFGSSQLHDACFNVAHALKAIGYVVPMGGLLVTYVQTYHQREQSDVKVKRLVRSVESSADAVIITDQHGTIEYVNPAFTQITGWQASEALGRNPHILNSGKMPPEFFANMWNTLRQGRTWSGRLINRRKSSRPSKLPILGQPTPCDEELIWVQSTMSPVLDEDGRTSCYVALQRDVTEDVEREEKQRRDRNHASVRASIARILQEQHPLKERLGRSVAVLRQLDELDVEHKAGIFLGDDEAGDLKLFFTVGKFTDDFLSREQRVPLGECLCGRAAVSGKLVVSDDCFCDPRHEHRYAGMTPHGHYIVPLKEAGHVLGVLFLYTATFPSRDENRLRLLEEVGEMMGQAVANERLNEALRAASEAAEAANRIKSNFLANMSHEIRTPMTAILGFADVLMENLSKPENVEAAKTIQRNGRHLLELINDILDLSKIEAGKLSVERMTCSPIRVVSDATAMMRVRAEAKGLPLVIEYSGIIPETIRTDPTRLRQILINLIGNAIKFTETGSVRVITRLLDQDGDEPKLCFEVTDSGIGMNETQIARLFRPFVQADTSTTRKFGGTGLGLTISKRLSEKLGGTISVRSTPSVGSTFSVTLPIGPLSGVKMIAGPAQPAANGSPPPQKTTHTRLSGRVLLAEDGLDNQRLISFVLKKAGAEVTVVENGQLAVEHALAAKAAGQPFDVVLMDMQMPVLDGYQATRQLRQAGYDRPIVALTAHAMSDARDQCLAAGCDDYTTKPIDRSHLTKLVADYTRQAREMVHAGEALCDKADANV